MHNINSFLFTLINQGAGYWPLLDRFFIVLTSEVTVAVLVLVLIYLVIIRPLKAHNAGERLQRLGAAAEAMTALFLTWGVTAILKVLVAFPRPFIALAGLQPLIANTSPFESFPSAHAALTMASAIAVLPYHKHLGHLLIAFSLVVALSRLYVGVHYPFDIGVGLLIGFLIPKLVHRVFRK